MLIPMESDAFAFHGGDERSRHLRVEEWQESVAAISDLNARAEDGKRARILGPDNARPYNRQVLGQQIQLQDRV